jgi:putative intracellular protease/amidase
VLLAPGFEEGEAIVVIDILRRLHLDVELLSCADSRAVVSYHDIPMVADSTLTERAGILYDAVVLPGGPQGSVNLAASRDVVAFISAHDTAGKLICPICSAAASARRQRAAQGATLRLFGRVMAARYGRRVRGPGGSGGR